MAAVRQAAQLLNSFRVINEDAYCMGIINLTTEEQNALSRLDVTELRRLIDQKQVNPLNDLQLSSCGLYVAQ